MTSETRGKRKSGAGKSGGGKSRPSGRNLTVRVRTARRRTNSSTRWLQRQLNDPYVIAAKKDGYRSRAAYKLLQLDERYGLLAKGLAVVDLGADLVLSDMAPPATGHRATDHLRIIALAEAALDLARAVLRPGGGFVAKVWQGGAEQGLLATIKRDFAVVRHAKPEASRSGSAEMYVVATGFRGDGAASGQSEI